MKIFFGGAFDPIHNGHITLALQIAQEFHHPVSFMPLNGNPNYKAPPKVNLAKRIAMLELVTKLYPQQLIIDDSEAKIPQYSPTYFSLTRLRQCYGDSEEFYFVIGGDSLVNLDSWDNYQQLFDLTNFIVATRADYPLEKMTKKLAAQVKPRISSFNYLKRVTHGKIYLSDFSPIDVSSTLIRSKIRNNLAVAELLPAAVNQFILNHNLYQGN